MLVDERDRELGVAGKLAAHEPPGRLHRAFSVFLLDGSGRTLLQQRAAAKYHFPLHWANACCSHPGPGEDVLASASRRVREELGVEATLEPAGAFTYRATCPASGLVEHEHDHVFVGAFDGDLSPDPAEVASTAWVHVDDLAAGRFGEPLAPWLLEGLALATRVRR